MFFYHNLPIDLLVYLPGSPFQDCFIQLESLMNIRQCMQSTLTSASDNHHWLTKMRNVTP